MIIVYIYTNQCGQCIQNAVINEGASLKIQCKLEKMKEKEEAYFKDLFTRFSLSNLNKWKSGAS